MNQARFAINQPIVGRPMPWEAKVKEETRMKEDDRSRLRRVAAGIPVTPPSCLKKRFVGTSKLSSQNWTDASPLVIKFNNSDLNLAIRTPKQQEPVITCMAHHQLRHRHY